ncbi:shikimate kinase [Staphylococcus carnosus]|uniref:Shikimate kinase n=1 Tax=Staphylococcus carnosus (strain TM300) TaxID=396513 RepID=B9DNN8_STACT|nr:shikimate kinase [Staphylococcus carnosus]QPT04194.1 shikimate kinase [Staphylococcus carnosus]UQA66919.1 shikimate kinase [Staphylococcus carnosus]GEP76674.1 shikimate kinase [Staphylococcus carnosus]CAL28070.1 putative shikimate kinase [Staphylococcus carnosus subsp. carnosus TM300]
MKKQIQKNEPLILIGFMGTGKSTLGEYIAFHENKTFADLDKVIEETVGKSIPSIFKDHGESKFRELEGEFLCESLEKYDIISTGGGIVESTSAMNTLSNLNNIIWLDTDIEIIYNRIKNDSNRPNASNKAFDDLKRLYLSRLSRYNEIAFSRIDTNIDIDILYQNLMNILNANDQYWRA